MTTTRQTAPVEHPRALLVFAMKRTNLYMRWPCHLCGGCTDKEGVECVAPCPGDGKPHELFACQQCVEENDPDARIAEQTAHREAQIGYLRSLLGRVVLPGADAWREAVAEAERQWREEYGEEYGEDPTLVDADCPF
jgi:hypothetical protein